MVSGFTFLLLGALWPFQPGRLNPPLACYMLSTLFLFQHVFSRCCSICGAQRNVDFLALSTSAFFFLFFFYSNNLYSFSHFFRVLFFGSLRSPHHARFHACPSVGFSPFLRAPVVLVGALMPTLNKPLGGGPLTPLLPSSQFLPCLV